MSEMAPDEAKAASNRAFAMLAADPEPGVDWTDMTIPSNGYDLPVRLYRPDDQDPKAPMMVYYHMGGGVIGDLETCHAFCSIIAAVARGPVLSVDYRLAPEHRWPTGLKDATNAYLWALRNAESYGAPPGMAAIAGDSMGGNFSAIIAPGNETG